MSNDGIQLVTTNWSGYSFDSSGWSTSTFGHVLKDGSRFEIAYRTPPRKWRPGEARDTDPDCRVYWGSHGCCLVRGHDGPCMCDCAWDENNNLLPHMTVEDNGNVGCPPYYGEDTRFYGEDAAARGLPTIDDDD